MHLFKKLVAFDREQGGFIVEHFDEIHCILVPNLQFAWKLVHLVSFALVVVKTFYDH